jgi:hypothetical protein
MPVAMSRSAGWSEYSFVSPENSAGSSNSRKTLILAKGESADRCANADQNRNDDLGSNFSAQFRTREQRCAMAFKSSVLALPGARPDLSRRKER